MVELCDEALVDQTEHCWYGHSLLPFALGILTLAMCERLATGPYTLSGSQSYAAKAKAEEQEAEKK